MAIAACLWDVRIINRTLEVCRFQDTCVSFLLCCLLWVTLMTYIACYSFEGMYGFRPLLVIRCRKLPGPVLMALKRTTHVPLKMLNPYLVELFLNFNKRR